VARQARGGGGRIALPPLPPSPTVLLLVDYVNPLDFEGAGALATAAVEAARATARLRRSLHGSDTQVVYANDNYGVWRSDFHALWERCRRMPGAPGELARALAPRKSDFTILKPRHSAFYETPLDLLLRQLHCKRLILAGLAAESCVLATAMDAYLRGYAVWAPADCVASESPEVREQALALMRRVLKADVRPSRR
jgi:nicotinamidase-related amidase